MRTFKDYKPETESLLVMLQAAGFELVSTSNNGEDFTAFRSGCLDEFINEVMGADDALLVVRRNGKESRLYLVFGNEPGVLVCDYHVSAALDAVVESHSAKWEGIPQPVRTARQHT